MRLKKIKLAGFKSFVDVTNIPFPGDMTAVVGPNGCGKSNVIDAVRWVLGESSAKNLRGDSMTDVIFNGSSARKSVSQCSVELVFDNSSGRIGGEYANYNELSVKRIVTKDAQSSYQLNNTKCRRRDVTDLFLGTGLGPRSYAIIEQGMISKLIESKPQELRVFIEEAAGISKYKERRRETENRIKHTKENLERLDDVRSELGLQLAKLQKQASVAKKFTELKVRERTFKGQLTAYRWLQQSNQQIETTKALATLNSELEDVIAQQSSDETSVSNLRLEQTELKLNITEKQHEIFTVGTDITKIEQTQIFTIKRKQQIQSEVSELIQQQRETKSELEAIQVNVKRFEEELVALAPEKRLLDETIDQIEYQQNESQEALREFELANRDTELSFEALRQNVQTCHSQIEVSTSLQTVIEKRLEELHEAKLNINESELQARCSQISEKLLEHKQAKSETLAHIDEQGKVLDLARAAHAAASEIQHNTQSLLMTAQAKQKALTALQLENTQAQAPLDNIESFPLWQYLNVKPGFERLVERVISTMPEAIVLTDTDYGDLSDTFWRSQGGQFCLLENAFTKQKQSGTLTDCFENDYLPADFLTIFIASDPKSAVALIASIDESGAGHASVICESGQWLFRDRVSKKEIIADGAIVRAMQLTSLDAEIQQLKARALKEQDGVHECAVEVSRLQQSRDDNKKALRAMEQASFELTLVEQQMQQALNAARENKAVLANDIEKQAYSLAIEQSKLDELNERSESVSAQLDDAECALQSAKEKKAQFNQQVEQYRLKYQEIVAQKHSSELHAQALNSKYQRILDKQTQLHARQAEFEEKLLILQDEAEELDMPVEEQQVRLSALIEHKQYVISMQQAMNEALLCVEEKLSLLEKGRSGLNQVANKIKSTIDAKTLLAEGCKVRAQGYLQQLQDMEQNLKHVLDGLPQDIDETAWQDSLDKISTSIAKLGAVNLAAVQEFEQQANRKQYLDEQNSDLVQALDTLETAIRKIDKETRARFKATFDQVNDDLKTLFPKVFGGGSAYLDLTTDDLLDTGVTIMARPPGKKNSTIHLLSGGEKALTALSLVFAIFRLNPAPFCLLDEVDAPLDDANVGRFCKLVSEMSKTVQFIYITHNKVAMEMATHLTGVTMSEPGVSRMVAVDVEEALAIAE